MSDVLHSTRWCSMSWADEPCPICEGPLEEVYYGGGVTKWECKGCVKHFITSITSDYED